MGCFLTARENIISISFRINRKGCTARGPHEIYALDEATGVKFPVLGLPKLGKMATPRGRRGQYGYIQIANIGHVVSRGSKINVVIGDFEAKKVAVV